MAMYRSYNLYESDTRLRLERPPAGKPSSVWRLVSLARIGMNGLDTGLLNI